MGNRGTGKLALNLETRRYLTEGRGRVSGQEICCTATGYIPCSCIPSDTAISFWTWEYYYTCTYGE